MNEATVRALDELNRRFYSDHAASFSATRQSPWPGWTQLLAKLGESGSSRAPLRVLDVGCGNGRFGRFLAAQRMTAGCEFHGVDASAPLIEEARQTGPPGARWSCADVVQQPGSLPGGPFDLIALFGVLHGVPAEARRRALLRACSKRLAPAGTLVFTLWRLAEDARLRARLLDRNAYSSRAPMPIDCSELEPGDHLLPWGDSGEVLRYCHAFDETEIPNSLAALGLQTAHRFRADGRSGEQNEYWLVQGPRDAAGS